MWSHVRCSRDRSVPQAGPRVRVAYILFPQCTCSSSAQNGYPRAARTREGEGRIRFSRDRSASQTSDTLRTLSTNLQTSGRRAMHRRSSPSWTPRRTTTSVCAHLWGSVRVHGSFLLGTRHSITGTFPPVLPCLLSAPTPAQTDPSHADDRSQLVVKSPLSLQVARTQACDKQVRKLTSHMAFHVPHTLLVQRFACGSCGWSRTL